MTSTRMPREPTAQTLMDNFAERTGIRSASNPQRYLWTDAFAVCNFLELSRRTGDANYCELALQLVDQVHHVLGRHRPDDSRSGWISGLGEREGEQHPTAGGLRIGKPLGERPPQEPLDDRLEWDRDGQYFHYLTKWMHALHRVSQETGDERYRRWAIELGRAAHASFTYQPNHGRSKRMVWKMSIDLSRPLVASQGQHDPLDGLITYRLGFRELGFSIGMRAVERLQQAARKDFQFAQETDWIMQHQPMAEKIEAFWRRQEKREADSWTARRDINDVMLATSLAPAGYLGWSLIDRKSPTEDRCRS